MIAARPAMDLDYTNCERSCQAEEEKDITIWLGSNVLSHLFLGAGSLSKSQQLLNVLRENRTAPASTVWKELKSDWQVSSL